MARGKHKKAKANRDARVLAAQLAAAQAELDGEKEQFAAAQAELAAIDELRVLLEQTYRERDEGVRGEVSRLRREVGLLAELVEEADATHERIHDRWSQIGAAISDWLGGGREGMERLLTLIGQGGTLMEQPGQRRLGAVAAKRIQRARGQRRGATDDGDDVDGPAGRSIAWLLRRRWRAIYDELLPGVTGAQAASPPDRELSAHERHRLGEADAAAEAVYRSHAWDVDLDAVHAWHPLPWIDSTVRHPEDSPVMRMLGTDLPIGSLVGQRPGVQLSVPTAALPATIRAGAAFADPEILAEAWSGALQVPAVVVKAAARIPSPSSPPPRYPRPGDAVAVKHWYAMAALGAWSRLHDTALDQPENPPNTHVAGEVAAGLIAAAPFWLPPGQTAGYVDSEPLASQDLTELRMPYPQTLLVLGDPLRLPPTATPPGADESDLAYALGQLDAALLWLRRRESAPTLSELVTSIADLEVWDFVPSLAAVLEQRGAHVEAVLLLADSLGRLADTFAWCVAVPAGSTGLLGRFVLPASRSHTAYADQVNNLAAVAAWADWHQPDQELTVPQDASARELAEIVQSSTFRRLEERGGAGAVRVLNVKRTGTARFSSGDGLGRTLTPHVRRGHWRRQHYGPQGQLVKRVRIAPVLVNAGKTGLAPQVYRLPTAATSILTGTDPTNTGTQ